MPTFTVAPGVAVNMNTFNLGALATGSVLVPGTSVIELAIDDLNFVDVDGSFSYTSGYLSGTVNQVHLVVGGFQFFSLTGATLDAPTFFAYAALGDSDAFL